MRKLAVLAAFAVAALGIVACGDDDGGSGGSSGGTQREIVLLTGDNHDPFFISMNAGAQAEAKKQGVKVTWQGPAQYDPGQQIQVLNSVMQRDPDFLLIAPCDLKALSQPLSEIKADGTPIITVDTDVAATEVRLANITSNNELGGKLAAQYIAKQIGDEGKVLFVDQAPGISTLDARKKGFEAELKSHPKIKYVGVRYTQDDPAKTAEAVSAVLQKHPDLKGIFAVDTLTGEGVATGVTNADKSEQITVVAFDASPSQVEAVRKGSIDALVVQKAYEMGELAVRQAVEYLEDGTKPAAMTNPDYVVADESNIDSADVTKYLYRDK